MIFSSVVGTSLKLTFRQYPAINTNYIISHCTTLIIIYNTILRQKQDFKHEKQLIKQCCHLSSLA